MNFDVILFNRPDPDPVFAPAISRLVVEANACRFKYDPPPTPSGGRPSINQNVSSPILGSHRFLN